MTWFDLTLGNDEDGRMVLVGVAQGVLLECSNRFPSIYTRTDHKVQYIY